MSQAQHGKELFLRHIKTRGCVRIVFIRFSVDVALMRLREQRKVHRIRFVKYLSLLEDFGCGSRI